MNTYQLRLTLESDATFGRGDGVAGLVDAEVQHDEVGLPYLAGRTLKGLLGAECAEILSALERGRPDSVRRWSPAAERLFGRQGAGLNGVATLHVGAARLPDDLRQALAADVEARRLAPTDVLALTTAVRRQTAMDAWGVPEENTLRSMRVILRETTFTAPLRFAVEPTADDLALLAACARALRRGGTGRNRGRGRLRAALLDTDGGDVTAAHFEQFKQAVLS